MYDYIRKEKNKQRQKAYDKKPERVQARKFYKQTSKGRAAQLRAQLNYYYSPKGQENHKRYTESEKRKAMRERYRKSKQGREVSRKAQKKYSQTPGGQVTRIKYETKHPRRGVEYFSRKKREWFDSVFKESSPEDVLLAKELGLMILKEARVFLKPQEVDALSKYINHEKISDAELNNLDSAFEKISQKLTLGYFTRS